MSDSAHRAPVAAPVGAPTTAQMATVVEPRPPAPRAIGLSHLRVFPAALGTNAFGWTIDAAEAARILDAFRDGGGDLIDTADSYAGGRSESIIGEWMRSRRNRDELVVATKVGRSREHPGVDARAITAAVHDSLGRLGTDRIDLLYLHVDDPDVPFEETLLAVDELILDGVVRHFGAAQHAGTRLIEARIASAQLGVAPMAAIQVPYSLSSRHEYETGFARIARAQGLGVLPRMPLPTDSPAGRSRRAARQLLTVLDDLAREVDATPSTVALAWLLSKPDVVAPVVAATAVDQVVDATTAAALRLTRRQLTELDRASEPFA